jgi:TRAP-type uncharacterized transport system substrate-binding protein
MHSTPGAAQALRYRALVKSSVALLPGRTRRWLDALIGAGPLVVALVLVLVVLALWAAYRALDPTPSKHIVIATGPDKGAYGEFGRRYVPLLRAQGVEVELRATQGSQDNLALLRDPKSGVQAAFVQSGIEPVDSAATQGVVSLGSVAYEPLWLFYREDSARLRLKKDPLDKLSQLQGWRVHSGPRGGGSGPLFQRLAQANGLPAGGLQTDERQTVHAVVDLVQGRIDALAMVSAADAPLVQYLLRTPGVQLFDFAQADAYSRRFNFLRAVTLPRGVADLATDEPPSDVRLVAATASLVARDDLHPALALLLVQAAKQVHGAAGWFARGGEFPNATSPEFPMSPEAERFYRNGSPWLQRYLPYWLANFVDRMWIVLLPLVAVLLPLSRVLPPLVDLRLRSRVFRWYAHLRAIDYALEAPTADLARLREDLERLDSQVERIGVPLAYTHELYQLRSHIQLVRKRLLLRQGGASLSAEAAA